MADLLTFLKTLISTSGLSGHEAPVRRLIETAWQPLVDETTTSRLGSLHGLKMGTGPEPRPGLLLAAHMDAIGMMVTGYSDGLLRVTEIGGLDPRVLPGQLVTVHGRQDYPGVVVQPPSHLLPPEASGKGVWKRRFEEINRFEEYLVNNGTILLKFFLNVSKEEQKKGFLERIELPEKNWK